MGLGIRGQEKPTPKYKKYHFLSKIKVCVPYNGVAHVCKCLAYLVGHICQFFFYDESRGGKGINVCKWEREKDTHAINAFLVEIDAITTIYYCHLLWLQLLAKILHPLSVFLEDTIKGMYIMYCIYWLA
jgi:hypothetical protein